eukprot:TRINITY_DN3548_c0_g2_i1.p1 TRINITY_DN3548_c0_g2~~TRINITY_DN3548_c0_g2_i1.p1  ORF type:complete len:167 (-),score=47.19 TRINITY_DN3548_c0_g2_i1:285-785(-)
MLRKALAAAAVVYAASGAPIGKTCEYSIFEHAAWQGHTRYKGARAKRAPGPLGLAKSACDKDPVCKGFHLVEGVPKYYRYDDRPDIVLDLENPEKLKIFTAYRKDNCTGEADPDPVDHFDHSPRRRRSIENADGSDWPDYDELEEQNKKNAEEEKKWKDKRNNPEL